MSSDLKNSAKKQLDTALDRIVLREYDLPLHKGADAGFLTLLVSLMSFLAILSLTGTFALSGMTARWSSGLENKVTIEIPIETSEGHLLSRDTMEKETKKVAAKLDKNPNVKDIKVLSDRDITELVSPWLGSEINFDEIPLPTLIAVEVKISNAETLTVLADDIKEASEFAVLQTHQDWLDDLIRFARTLQYLAFSIALIVSAATITAIAAGIRARFAIYKKEVELLHLMGASDDYIARQFQKHAIIIALKGGAIGAIAGIFVTIIIIILSGFSGTSLLPRIEISIIQFLALSLVPILACMIAGIVSRITVLRTLAKMP